MAKGRSTKEQNTTQKTKDCATQTPQTTGGEYTAVWSTSRKWRETNCKV